MGVVDSEKRGQWLNHLELNGGFRVVGRFRREGTRDDCFLMERHCVIRRAVLVD